jgi:hypothetical protein
LAEAADCKASPFLPISAVISSPGTPGNHKDIAMTKTIDKLKAVADAAKEVPTKDLRALRAQIDEMIKADEAKTSAEAKRLARMKAALEDDAMEPTVRYCHGRLRSLGLDFHAAADLGKLNKALTEGNVPNDQRFAIKAALTQIGVL